MSIPSFAALWHQAVGRARRDATRPAATATERFLTIWDRPRSAAEHRARQRRTRRPPRFYL